jgi:hypothetical protein
VPLRPTATVLLVDALLSTLSWPVTAPAVWGSKFKSSVSAKFGFKITGNVAPDMVKPVPLKMAELIVTVAVPVDVMITGSVDVVFTVTFPKATLAVLMFKAATFATELFNCIAKVLETPPTLAVKVTACAVATADTVVVNPALVAFAGTVTVAGTVTAALPLVKPTLKPPLPAAVLSVTVQASVPAPVKDALMQEIVLSDAEATVLVPPLTVLVALPPDALPQPETATATKEHADKANRFAHKPSSMRVALRLPREHELNNVLTSVDSPALLG